MGTASFSGASLVAASCAALVALACGCQGIDAAHAAVVEPSMVPVRLAPVSRGALARITRGAGTVHLKSEFDLSFKVGGVVTQVFADEGTRVRKGQVLARLDATEVSTSRSQATFGLDRARRDLERAQALLDAKAIPLADFQNAQTGVAVAQATVEAASFNERQAEIIAPDRGVIDRVFIAVGEIAAPGMPALHLSGATRGAVVRTPLPDREVMSLHAGTPARIRLDVAPDNPLAAHVAQIATVAAPGSCMFEVELKLEDANALPLLAGLTAKVEIEHTEQAQLSVPVAALVDGQGREAAVYIVEGGRAKRVPVRVKYFTDARAVLDGEFAHAQVIAEGAPLLADGTLVRVVP